MHCELSKSNVLASQMKLRTILGSIMHIHKKVRVFDPLDIFCDKEKCFYFNGEIIYFYNNQHVSIRGSNYYAAHFLKWLHSSQQQ